MAIRLPPRLASGWDIRLARACERASTSPFPGARSPVFPVDEFIDSRASPKPTAGNPCACASARAFGILVSRRQTEQMALVPLGNICLGARQSNAVCKAGFSDEALQFRSLIAFAQDHEVPRRKAAPRVRSKGEKQALVILLMAEPAHGKNAKSSLTVRTVGRRETSGRRDRIWNDHEFVAQEFGVLRAIAFQLDHNLLGQPHAIELDEPPPRTARHMVEPGREPRSAAIAGMPRPSEYNRAPGIDHLGTPR